MNALTDACRQFEAVVLRQSLEAAGFGRTARAGGPDSDDAPDEGEPQTGIFQSLVVETLADAVARAGGIGLARELERALTNGRR